LAGRHGGASLEARKRNSFKGTFFSSNLFQKILSKQVSVKAVFQPLLKMSEFFTRRKTAPVENVRKILTKQIFSPC
jgi:hypothetical protein